MISTILKQLQTVVIHQNRLYPKLSEQIIYCPVRNYKDFGHARQKESRFDVIYQTGIIMTIILGPILM